MKKYFFMIFIVFTLLFSFISCNQENDPISSPEESNVVKSLKVGNRWTFRITALDSLGIETNAYTVTFTIVRDTIVQGEKWYVLNNGNNGHQLITNRENGFWTWSYYYLDPPTAPELQAKYPVSINDSWRNYDNSLRRCTAKDVFLKSPLGDYRCIQYSILSEEGDILVNYYYSPGVGDIKGEYYRKDKNQKYYLSSKKELIEARIN